MRKLAKRDPSAAYVRHAIAARKVGDRKCGCGEARPKAVNPKSNPLVCYDCRRRKEGKIRFDNHHVAGKSNSPATLQIPVNDHCAQLNEDQHDWPKETLENPDGCPLLARAGCVRGYIDTDIYLIEKFLLPRAEMDEELSKFLVEKLGRKWWRKTELAKFAPKR